MSRLDSAIRRLEAQRACLDLAAGMVAGLPGPVVEIGLGNGRTYDHLREILPGREIFVFDRAVDAHPDCRPDEAHMLLGDLADTLPGAAVAIGAPAAFAHCDFGSGVPDRDRETARLVAGALPALLAPGAVVASDQPLAAAALDPLPLPDGIAAGRYHLYRHRR